MDGLNDWLEAVYTARIPCAVVSSLDRRNMLEALERMGLSKYFQVGFKKSVQEINSCLLSPIMALKSILVQITSLA